MNCGWLWRHSEGCQARHQREKRPAFVPLNWFLNAQNSASTEKLGLERTYTVLARPPSAVTAYAPRGPRRTRKHGSTRRRRSTQDRTSFVTLRCESCSYVFFWCPRERLSEPLLMHTYKYKLYACADMRPCTYLLPNVCRDSETSERRE